MERGRLAPVVTFSVMRIIPRGRDALAISFATTKKRLTLQYEILNLLTIKKKEPPDVALAYRPRKSQKANRGCRYDIIIQTKARE